MKSQIPMSGRAVGYRMSEGPYYRSFVYQIVNSYRIFVLVRHPVPARQWPSAAEAPAAWHSILDIFPCRIHRCVFGYRGVSWHSCPLNWPEPRFNRAMRGRLGGLDSEDRGCIRQA